MSEDKLTFKRPEHNYGTRLRNRRPGGMSREEAALLNTGNQTTGQGEQAPSGSGPSLAAVFQNSVVTLLGTQALASHLISARRSDI